MKKLFVIILLAGFSLPAFSQNSGFGIKAGVNNSDIKFETEEFFTWHSYTGYHVGIFARLDLGGLLIQPELLFTQTGGEFVSNDLGSNGSERFNANFNRLDIPLMFGVKMFKLIRLQAGPVASINVNSNLENSIGTVTDVDFKQATLGYQAGLGLDIGNLFIDAKYEGGLSKVTGQIAGFETDNRLNQWILSVGFKIF
ncbi:MAG: PorT family outer membrane secretin [Algoriphagus marincola HL-49]|uniref:PorT family outer membrane secretin n=1 Tax=Algoriphagus marincola HL-49 TaxID=1305737 RepID=A0A0P8ACL6_9BACT|nr:MAG: PorT family outer membrane secretin [Algoriphagus marincola HL-49]